jgi:hypothetical protein
MSEQAHSPAPFRLESHPTCHRVVDAFGDTCAALASCTGDHSREEQLANAQLFTASPKLLAELKAIVDRADPMSRSPHYDAARRAIAEAEGRL